MKTYAVVGSALIENDGIYEVSPVWDIRIAERRAKAISESIGDESYVERRAMIIADKRTTERVLNEISLEEFDKLDPEQKLSYFPSSARMKLFDLLNRYVEQNKDKWVVNPYGRFF